MGKYIPKALSYNMFTDDAILWYQAERAEIDARMKDGEDLIDNYNICNDMIKQLKILQKNGVKKVNLFDPESDVIY